MAAARAIARGEVDRAVNFCGGLHHAMADSASGFGVYNDAALSIAAMLQSGVRKVAYVDVDVHHADGVQAAFYADPRVLTVSVHQSPLSLLFPGTGYPTECGDGAADGTSVNIALPAGTTDASWLRAFHAVVPGRGARVPAGGTGHPARRGLASGGSVGRPETDRRRSPHVVRGAARAGRIRHRWSMARSRRWRVLAGAGGAPLVDPPAGNRVRSRHRPGDAAACRMAVAGRGGPSRDCHAGRHVRRHTAPGDLPALGRDGSTWPSTAPSGTPVPRSTPCTGWTLTTPAIDRLTVRSPFRVRPPVRPSPVSPSRRVVPDRFSTRRSRHCHVDAHARNRRG